MEFLISLPAPKINEPLELEALLATPTMLLAIPEYWLEDVADSMLFNEPVIVAPKFFTASDVSFPPL